MRLWTHQALFWLLVFFCLRVETGASEQDYPLILEGRDGFYFFLLTRDSEVFEGQGSILYARSPVMALDGTALYEGYRLASPEKRVRLSFQQLLDSRLLRHLSTRQPELESDWIPESLRLKVDHAFVQEVISALEENPEALQSALSGMSESRGHLLSDFLLAERIQLSAEHLQDFRRTAEKPVPAPTQFDFAVSWDLAQQASGLGCGGLPITEALGEEAKRSLKDQIAKWGFEQFLNISYSVQVSEIALSVRERLVTFDPETNWLGVEIYLNEIEFSGDILSQADILFPTQVRAGEWMRQRLKLGPRERQLTRGSVEGAYISVQLHLSRDEEDGFWVLETAPNTTPELGFIRPPSPVESERALETWNPCVELEMQYINAKGKLENESIHFDLSGQLRLEFERNFRESLSPALTFRSLMNQWGWVTNRVFQAEDGGAQAWAARSRLADFLVLRDGLEFRFDVKTEVTEVAGCLGDLPRRWMTPLEPLAAQPEDPVHNSGRPWVLEWKLGEDSRWRLRTSEEDSSVTRAEEFEGRLAESPPESSLGLRLSETLVNSSLEAAFWAGELCVSNRRIWPRFASMPLIVLTPQLPPRVSWRTSRSLGLHFSFALQSFGRDPIDIFQSFQKGDLSREFEMGADIQFDPELRRLQIETNLFGASSASPRLMERVTEADLEPGEAESILRILLLILNQMHIFSSAEIHLDWPIAIEWSNFSTPVVFEDLRIQMTDLFLDGNFFSSSFQSLPGWGLLDGLELLRSQELGPSDSVTSELHTRWVKKPDFRVFSERLELSWAQAVEDLNSRVLYSYRLGRPAGDSNSMLWGNWSKLQRESYAVLRLTDRGLHQIEVIAISPEYELESQVRASASFFFEGSQGLSHDDGFEDEGDDSSWESPQEPRPPEESTARTIRTESTASKSSASRGVFGCQLQPQTKGPPMAGIAWSLAALLLILLVRSRTNGSKAKNSSVQHSFW